jgi:glycosyltransferase involved in cell wall biosynthesis
MADERTPLLSVGLPVWNGLPYLEKTLRSILDGEFQDYEIIACDNASTDGTAELLTEYAARDARIRYVRNETNIGAARNYNRTLELARGRYFRWMASDDLHSPGAIARCVEALEQDPGAVLAFPETRVIDGEGRVTHDYDDGDGWSAASPVDRFVCSLENFGLSTRMFGVIRADVLRRATLQGDYPASDLVMQSDLAIRGRFVRVHGEYFYRRVHQGSTQNLDAVQLAQFYVPDRTTAFPARQLRVLLELFRVVVSAPVSVRDKLRMLSVLARRAFWHRRLLARELGALLTLRSEPRRAHRGRPPGGGGKPLRRKRTKDETGSRHPA